MVATPGVIRILSLGGQPTPLASSEVENIRSAVNSDLPIQAWHGPEQGDEIEVLRAAHSP